MISINETSNLANSGDIFQQLGIFSRSNSTTLDGMDILIELYAQQSEELW